MLTVETIKPLKTKILCELLPEKKMSDGGLYLAETIKEIPRRGKVLEVGGNFSESIKKDDIVHFKRTWNKFFDINAKKCVFLTKDEMIGIERLI